MSAAEKRLEAMRRNPAGDWRIEDVEAVCVAFGLTLSMPRRGSHAKVRHALVHEILTIPTRRPIKPVYIRDLITYIDGVRGRHA